MSRKFQFTLHLPPVRRKTAGTLRRLTKKWEKGQKREEQKGRKGQKERKGQEGKKRHKEKKELQKRKRQTRSESHMWHEATRTSTSGAGCRASPPRNLCGNPLGAAASGPDTDSEVHKAWKLFSKEKWNSHWAGMGVCKNRKNIQITQFHPSLHIYLYLSKFIKYICMDV